MEWAAFVAKLVALVILVSLLASFVTTLDPGAFEGRDKPRHSDEIHSRLAALRAGELGAIQAEERRSTGGFADVERLAAVWEARHGAQAGGLLGEHMISVTPERDRYLLTVYGGPGGGSSFALNVDALNRTVVASCLTRADHGCRGARWDPEELAGVTPEQLLP